MGLFVLIAVPIAAGMLWGFWGALLAFAVLLAYKT